MAKGLIGKLSCEGSLHGNSAKSTAGRVSTLAQHYARPELSLGFSEIFKVYGAANVPALQRKVHGISQGADLSYRRILVCKEKRGNKTKRKQTGRVTEKGDD